jgi:hypothetical protein
VPRPVTAEPVTAVPRPVIISAPTASFAFNEPVATVVAEAALVAAVLEAVVTADAVLSS